jgi:uncharacterized protein (TIGR03000 family)
MYSIVLMAALAAPAESPSWGWRSGCCGGGCHGATVAHAGGGCVGYGPIAYYGFAGCYGSCYGSYTNYFSYWSTPPNVHYGYGMPMKASPAMPPPVTVPKPLDKKGDKTKGESNVLPPAAANVIISLPAEATLYANGYKTGQSSAERAFVTPALPQGQTFYYVFTAETIRDGKTVAETRRIEVTAGGTARVNFGDMPAAQPKADPTRVVIGGRIGQ